jgi:hypothetical protein
LGLTCSHQDAGSDTWMVGNWSNWAFSYQMGTPTDGFGNSPRSFTPSSLTECN